MLLRKINAILSWLTTLFLLTHAISTSIWMLSRGGMEQISPVVSQILAGLMAVHAFISIYLVSSVYMDGNGRGGKHYSKMNRGTIFQRVSGILLVIFTVLHIAGMTGPLRPPRLIHTILPPLFFAIALTHTAVSTEKAFITLGIGSARLVKVIGVISRVICAATWIASVTGFYLYVW